MTLAQAENRLNELQDERLILEMRRRLVLSGKEVADIDALNDKIESLSSHLHDLVSYIGVIRASS